MFGLGLVESIPGDQYDTTLNHHSSGDNIIEEEQASRGSKMQPTASEISEDSSNQRSVDLYRIKIRVSNEQAPSGYPENCQCNYNSTLSKVVEDLISDFPAPPSHIPAPSEVPNQTSYSNMSNAAMKVVSFGLGSLRHGFADKWLSKK